MTIPMPDPVAWRSKYKSEPGMIGHYPWSHSEHKPKLLKIETHYDVESLITTAQAEAYADRRVREAYREAYRAAFTAWENIHNAESSRNAVHMLEAVLALTMQKNT